MRLVRRWRSVAILGSKSDGRSEKIECGLGVSSAVVDAPRCLRTSEWMLLNFVSVLLI